MVDINQGECGAGLLATFPSHCRLWPWLTSYWGWFGTGGNAPQHLVFWSEAPLYLLNSWLTASGCILTSTKRTPQNLSASGTVKNVAYIFYYGYDWTQYCYPGILLCENEENQFHLSKERLKCLRPGSCSFIIGILNGLKWEGQEIEWRFCILELPRDTLRVIEGPQCGGGDWVCIDSGCYGCIRF